jgi:predicted transcriptional regulator
MRAPALALTVLLLASPVAGATVEVQFVTPAQAGPVVSALDATWALIVFGPHSAGAFDVSFPSPATDLNDTTLSLLTLQDPVIFGENSAPLREQDVKQTSTQPPFDAHTLFGGVGSLYVHGHIQLHAEGVSATLRHQTSTDCLDTPLGQREHNLNEARYRDLCPEPGVGVILRTRDSIQFSLAADSLDTVEWHNAHPDCPRQPCPDGGQRTEDNRNTPALNMTNRVLGYHQLTTSGASVNGTGAANLVIFGGVNFDFQPEGWLRLPLAVTDSCLQCVRADNQTLYITGKPQLVGLHMDGNHMAAGLNGTLASARIDETPINPLFLFAAGIGTTAAAAVVVVGLVWLFLFLFSRAHHAELTEKRRLVLEAVQAHPGAHLRELVRITGLHKNTLSYQLGVLRTGGHVIERRRGRTLCYFENHGRYGDEWEQIALLRDPIIRQLYDWLVGQPCSRPELRKSTSLWGWNRSTTYARLKRLQEAGLATKPGRSGIIQALQPTMAPDAVKP